MKTITIPTFMNPFKCKINNKEYSYPAGSTQTVPDEVAALIADINANAPSGYREPALDFSVQKTDTVILRLKQGVIYADTIKPIEHSGLFPNGVPAFADATPEQIAWIAKNDDPSKYWSAGDYRVKKVTVPDYSNSSVVVSDEETEASISGPNNIEVFFEKTGIKESGTYSLYWAMADEWKADIWKDGKCIWIGNPEDLSFTLISSGYCTLTVVYATVERDVYLSIAGFNHDDVVNKAAYGKQKAGLSLMVGASRARTGNEKVGVFLGDIDGISVSGGHYDRPNKGAKNYSSASEYRVALQDVLEFFPEFAGYVQKVKKLTARYFKHKNHYTDWLETEDKVFLPSEYEIFGEVLLAPSKEGEQYEIWKNGESKIIVTPELKTAHESGTELTYSRLWLRSGAAQYVNPSLPPVPSYTPFNSLTDNSGRVGDDSDYNDSIFMSYNPTNSQYNYYSGVAHSNNQAPYLLPMFCL